MESNNWQVFIRHRVPFDPTKSPAPAQPNDAHDAHDAGSDSNRFPSDLTDREWALITPLLPPDTRKRKLLGNQKSGKKKMRQFGEVEIPQQAFINALKMDG